MTAPDATDADAAPSPAAWRAAGATFAWRDHAIFFRDSGPRDRAAAAPLLLLHGYPTSSWDWRALWPALAAAHRVIALDYLGFGWSAKPAAGPYSIFAYADQAEALLAHLGVDEVHLLAHDLGDTVAQELLARDRERRAGARPGGPTIRSACLLNGGLFPETHRARPVQTLLAGRLGRAVSAALGVPRLGERLFARGLADVFGAATQPSRAELAGFWQGVHAGGGTRIQHRLIGYMAERRRHRARWVAPLCEPAVPWCFVDGLDDPVSGAHVVERVRALCPAARVVELPGIGHYPLVEAPAAVLAAYQGFRAAIAS